jgi:flagellar hook-basal body complex protein FliE
MSIFITSLDPTMVSELGLARPERATQRNLPQNGTAGAVPFANVLQDIVGSASQSLHQAEEASTAFARGQQNDLHGTMIALSQANVRLQLVNQTRNHLLEAYREVMRMNV